LLPDGGTVRNRDHLARLCGDRLAVLPAMNKPDFRFIARNRMTRQAKTLSAAPVVNEPVFLHAQLM